MPVPGVTNSFAVDYQAGETVVDINNPPKQRYVHQEFPKLMYHHESGQVVEVADEKQARLATKKGFRAEPAPSRDYSQIKAGTAAVKESGPARQVALDAAELAEMDEEPES